MSASLNHAREAVALRMHIAWLNGVLRRLGDLQVMASTIDFQHELAARLQYARAAHAASARQHDSVGSADHPPTLTALIVGQALLHAPEEQAAITAHRAGADRLGEPPWATAWCDFDGRIGVSLNPPGDELRLATGQAHVLWHWIEALAVRGQDADGACWRVPGFAGAATLEAKSDAARAFAAALDDAGRTVETLLARPAAGAVA